MSNGNGYIAKVLLGLVISLIVVSVSLWIGNIYAQMDSFHESDMELFDIGKANAVKISRLEECAANTRMELEKINGKLDRILNERMYRS